jgi:hypothetical protein
VLKGCERGAGEGIVCEEVGEGRDDGVALGGVVEAGTWSSSPRVLGGQ